MLAPEQTGTLTGGEFRLGNSQGLLFLRIVTMFNS